MNRRKKKLRSEPLSEAPIREEDCFNIHWKIKKFSYGWKEISSPRFILSGGNWKLGLKPKAVWCEIKSSACDTRWDKLVNIEISFLTCDGSQEAVAYGTKLEVSKDIIFGERRSAFLPEDTLTVRCRIKATCGQKGSVLIRSRIGVKDFCFLWTLKNFANEGCDKERRIESSYGTPYGIINLTLKSVGGINSDEQFQIEISRKDGLQCYCILKVSVLDLEGKILNYASDEFVFKNHKFGDNQIWRFPLVIRNSKLLSSKTVLLPNDILSLKCFFAISLGELFDQSVVYSYAEDVIPLQKLTDDPSIHLPIEKSPPKDLMADLKNMLDDRTFCDVNLRIVSHEIQAHKIILSARSAVFKAMFTRDMKESIDKTVVIDDLSFDTVRRLLLYMYTDAIHDYQWENIKNLYFASDKYGVLSLRQKCSSFFLKNLSFTNVCEILVLADLHQDGDLLSDVHDFLRKYNREVFTSEAWKEFEKNNSSLALKTQLQI